MAGEQILVVDDNSSNLVLTEFLLKAAGYSVVCAVSAIEGLEKLKAGGFRLVLMDIEMPGMDGLVATRLIKADPRLAPVRVVALTAYAMAGDHERCLEAGCAGYISKPIDTRSFAQSVGQYLKTSGSNP